MILSKELRLSSLELELDDAKNNLEVPDDSKAKLMLMTMRKRMVTMIVGTEAAAVASTQL